MSEVEWTRIFLVYFMHSFIIIFFLAITIRILRRNKNRLTLILSIFYLLAIIGFIFNLMLLPINKNPTSTILYLMTFFFISFGLIFLVVFLRNLLNIDINASLKVDCFIIFLYGVLILIPFLIPEGFRFNKSTNWIPSTIIFKKLYNKFEKVELKTKLRYFIAGSYGMFFSSYGAVLYNTWQNPIFKLIWTFLSLIIIPSGFLIYYGIARDL